MKRIFVVLALVLLLGVLCVPILADSPTETVTPTETEPPQETGIDGETQKMDGQIARAVYDFWAYWFPDQWVQDFPDMFVLLTIASTLAFVFGVMIYPFIKMFK